MILAVIVFLFWGLSASAQQLYVNQASGSDRNMGTKARPFATFEKALQSARELRKTKSLSAPITIILTGKSYQLSAPIQLTQEDAGTETSPLIITTDPKSPAAISGGIQLGKFTANKDGLWQLQLSPDQANQMDIQQLFIGGRRATRARTPNIGEYYPINTVTEKIIDTGKLARQYITLTPSQLQLISSAKNPGTAEGSIISVNHAWDVTRKYIDSIDTKKSAAIISGNPMKPWNKLTNEAQFYLENDSSFLDQPGEFFYDKTKNKLYYLPRPGEGPKTSTITVPVLEHLLTITGTAEDKASYIQLKNLKFQYTHRLMGQNGDEPVQAAAPAAAAITIDHAININISGIEMTNIGAYAIWVRKGCSNNTITRCYLHNLGIGGIKIGEIAVSTKESEQTGSNLIDNNIIREGGFEIPTGIAVLVFQSAGNTITHNEIADFRYTGISAGWTWGYGGGTAKNNTISYNHIHHIGWGQMSDMGGIYTLAPANGTTIRFNHIHDIYSYGYGGWGMYTDEGSTDVLMENNLVYRCKSSGFHQNYGKNNIVRNNIFGGQWAAQLEANRIEPHHSFSFTNNIIYFTRGNLTAKNWEKISAKRDSNLYWNPNSPSLKVPFDTHALTADPMFRDPANGDFRFKSETAIKKIGFRPFDISAAGVYGSRKWKKLARTDPKMAAAFDAMVSERLKGNPQR